MLTETQARESLTLPVDKDPRVTFEISWDAAEFDGSECCVKNCPHVAASVHIDWTKPGYDEDTDAPNSLNLEQSAYCWEHAPIEIAEALNETAPFSHDPEVYVTVVVNGWYMRYAMPTQVAA